MNYLDWCRGTFKNQECQKHLEDSLEQLLVKGYGGSFIRENDDYAIKALIESFCLGLYYIENSKDVERINSEIDRRHYHFEIVLWAVIVQARYGNSYKVNSSNETDSKREKIYKNHLERYSCWFKNEFSHDYSEYSIKKLLNHDFISYNNNYNVEKLTKSFYEGLCSKEIEFLKERGIHMEQIKDKLHLVDMKDYEEKIKEVERMTMIEIDKQYDNYIIFLSAARSVALEKLELKYEKRIEKEK